MIDGPEPRTVDNGPLVGLSIVFVHVAPVAGLMPLNPFEDVLLGEGIQGTRCRENAAESELGNGCRAMNASR